MPFNCSRLFGICDEKYVGPKGDTGPAGLSVIGAIINGSGHLIVTLSDNSTIDAGAVSGGGSGVSVSGATVNGSGHLIITLTNGSNIDAGYVVGPTGATGATGATGPQGPAGSGGSGSGGMRTFYASAYSTAQQAVDAAKGQLLILDKMFTVSAPVTMIGATYNGTRIQGTDQLGVGFTAGQALNDAVLDVRASNVTLNDFSIVGGNFAGNSGLAMGDRQTASYQAKKCASMNLIIRQTTVAAIRFYDQIDYIQFWNLRAVDENTGKCIYLDNPAGTIYDNGNVRFDQSFFSSVDSILKRNAVAGTFHRLVFTACQFNGSNGAARMIDLDTIHETNFFGCTFETSGGAAPGCMMWLTGYNQCLVGCTFSGNGNTPASGVIAVDPAYGPYQVQNVAIENWSGTTVGWYASSPVRVAGAEDTTFVGLIGTKFHSNMIVGPAQYNPSAQPTLNANGSIALYFDGTNYKLAAKINGVVKTVTLT